MCMTEQSELSYQAMDETADWGVTHLRQPRRDNVIPMPTKPVHELHAHVKPETGNTTGSKARDFVVMWLMGIDWFLATTGALAFVSGVLTIVGGMLALATLLGHTDVLPRVFAAIGVAL